MIIKFVSFASIIICLAVLSVTPVSAAKKFIPKAKNVKRTISSKSIPVVVRYRPDKLGILFSFSNFNGIESVNYSFTYNTNGVPQGAGGTIRANNNPTSERELLFGTCSTSVCTYHYNLSGARLTFTANYSNGTKTTKSYKIKTYR